MAWHTGITGCCMLLLCLLASRPVLAELRCELALSGLDFDYEEFDARGTTLDAEDGLLPGLQAGLRWQRPDRFFATDLVWHAGRVDYAAPPAVTTRTDERIIDWNARFGVPLARYQHALIEGYAGAGYRDWRRDIRSTATRFGLVETYRWWYWQLGLRGEQTFGDRTRLGVDARLLMPIEPELDARFMAKYDDITVYPQARTGGRIALRVEHDLQPGLLLWVSPWFEYWELAASPYVSLQQGGVPLSPPETAREPDSETRHAGVMLGISWRL